MTTYTASAGSRVLRAIRALETRGPMTAKELGDVMRVEPRHVYERLEFAVANRAILKRKTRPAIYERGPGEVIVRGAEPRPAAAPMRCRDVWGYAQGESA